MRNRLIAEVHWTDSAARYGWEDFDDNHEALRLVACRTVGYIVRDDEDMLSLAQSLGDSNDTVNGAMTIPRAVIQKIVFLEPKP